MDKGETALTQRSVGRTTTLEKLGPREGGLGLRSHRDDECSQKVVDWHALPRNNSRIVLIIIHRPRGNQDMYRL